MDNHTIQSAAAARRRSLRSIDSSRYGTLRLVIQTQGLTEAVVSVVKERIGGGRIDGTRLAFCRISRCRPDGEPLTDVELLSVALEALRRQA